MKRWTTRKLSHLKKLLPLLLFATVLNSRTLLAAPPVSIVNESWEKLSTDQLVLSYFSLGLIGDLYRAKIYPKEKVLRYTSFITEYLNFIKKTFNSARPRGSRAQKLWFNRYKAILDLLNLALENLQGSITNKPGKSIAQFITYRNAAAQDLKSILKLRAKRYRSLYRNRRKWSTSVLSKSLAGLYPLSFLAIGTTADGYFQLLLTPQQTKGYLASYRIFFKNWEKVLKKLSRYYRGLDRLYIKKLLQLNQLNQQYLENLEKFIDTRDRKHLLKYIQLRRQIFRKISL